MTSIRNVFLSGVTCAVLVGSTVCGADAASDRAASRQALAPIALNSLSSPPDKIATARVVDDKGAIVGAVQKVELGAGGNPTQVEIALLGSDRVVTLDSRQLSYDEANNVVTAALDKRQFAQLPPARG